MTILQSIVLGTIQGLTEFLPVSSSGHLVLAQELMGVHEPGVTFEVITHMATLLSVLIYFRKPLFRMVRSLFDASLQAERRMIGYLFVGTLPAAVIGVAFQDTFEAAYENPTLVSGLLLVTGTILLVPRMVGSGGDREIRIPSALGVGLAQAFAILPGVSRSGSTIVAGLVQGVRPAQAAEFSFLLSIPVIAGATVFKFKNILDLTPAERAPIIDALGIYVWGAVFAFLFGLIAVYLVLATIRKGRFEHFAYYCYAAGILGLIYFGIIQN